MGNPVFLDALGLHDVHLEGRQLGLVGYGLDVGGLGVLLLVLGVSRRSLVVHRLEGLQERLSILRGRDELTRSTCPTHQNLPKFNTGRVQYSYPGQEFDWLDGSIRMGHLNH